MKPFLLSITIALTLCASSSLASDPTGVWKGKWTSQSTRHQGPMRAVVRPNGQGGYTARFTGRFFAIIPFFYRTTMNPVIDANGNEYLYSEKSLGPLFGSYRMSTTINEPFLHGSFTAAGDVGSIQMQRIR